MGIKNEWQGNNVVDFLGGKKKNQIYVTTGHGDGVTDTLKDKKKVATCILERRNSLMQFRRLLG